MPDPSEILLGLLLPVLVAGLAGLLGARGRAGALALGVAYLAGHLGLRGWRGWVPHESADWIAVGAATGLVLGLSGLSRWVAVRWLAAAGLAWLMLGGLLERESGLAAALATTAVLGLVSTLVWTVLDAEAESGSGAVDLAGLTLVAIGVAAAVGLSGSRLLGQLTGVLAAALGGLTLASLRRPMPSAPRGVAPVVVLTLGSLVEAGLFVSELPATAAALLAVGPLALRLPRGRSPGLAGGLVPLGGVLALVVAAAWIAHEASPAWDGIY